MPDVTRKRIPRGVFSETLSAIIDKPYTAQELLAAQGERGYTSARYGLIPIEGGSMSALCAPIEVFLSYAPEDESLCVELEKHLSQLQRDGLITVFHKRKIVVGQDWTKALDEYLSTASIILLLVSAHFVASDYCYGVEMQRAMERHATGEAYVIPLLLATRRRVKYLALRAPADYPNEGFEKPQVLLPDTAKGAWQTQKHQPCESIALNALQTFPDRVLIVESGKDELVSHQTIANYVNALKDKEKLTHIVIEEAGHRLQDEKSRAEYHQILINWFSK